MNDKSLHQPASAPKCKKNRRVRMLLGLAGFSAVGAGVAALAASCGAGSTQSRFVYNTNTTLLDGTSTPLNPGFTNAPIDIIAASNTVTLLTYETTGQIQVDQNNSTTFTDPGSSQPTDHVTTDTLRLEGATRVDAYKYMTDDQGRRLNAQGGVWKDGDEPAYEPVGSFVAAEGSAGDVVNSPWFLETTNPDGTTTTTPTTYTAVTQTAVKYSFTINQNIDWVNANGQTEASLSGKDFERGIETYWLASELTFSRNGYFLDMMGLDEEKTLNTDPTTGKVNQVSDKDLSSDIVASDYPTENYTNTDDKFTLYINSPYPYVLSFLSKSSYAAVPHTNQYVKNINMAEGTPIAYIENWQQDADGNNIPGTKTRAMDANNTNMQAIFGAGPVGTILDRTWFAGPYYINAFTQSQILYLPNDSYLDNVKLGNPRNQHLKSLLLNYGSGSPEVFYTNYLGGQSTYATVPSAHNEDAVQQFSSSGQLRPLKTIQTAQSNYIAYTPNPYLVDKTGKVTVNNYIDPRVANLLYHSESESGLIFKAGMAGLVDWYYLSKIYLPSGDFNLSSVPYGVFRYNGDAARDVVNTTNGATANDKLGVYGAPDTELYSDISQGKLYGGLPRPYSDYAGKQPLLGGFTIPYYKYANGAYAIDLLTVNQDTFRQVLKKYEPLKDVDANGGTASGPLNIGHKYGESAGSVLLNNYHDRLAQSMNSLGGGDMNFVNNSRDGANPTSTEWYTNQSSALGYSYWSPDYNGVGTWLEADAQLDPTTTGPATNCASTFPATFKLMMVAVKDLQSMGQDVTIDASGAKYATPTEQQRAKSIFNGDPRITSFYGAGNGYKFAMMGVNFLDYLIKQRVLDPTKISQLVRGSVQDPDSAIKTLADLDQDDDTAAPTTEAQVRRFRTFFFNDNGSYSSGDYSTKMGIFAGYGDAQAMWLSIAADFGFVSLPKTAAGLKEVTLTLVKPQFIYRASSVGNLNYRDFGFVED